jgi:hypothetical protein
MRSVIIYDRNNWRLLSQGNGAFYTLTEYREDGSYSVCFQGDDAESFRKEFDAIESDESLYNFLSLFNEYSEVMTPEVITLDEAQTAFEEQRTIAVAATYLRVLMQYETDGMIGDDTWLNGLEVIQKFLDTF